MPSRILREGILSSPRMAKLGWAEEVFYRRLMSVVDDFGRFSADPGMLRAACYPRQLGKVSDPDIVKWLQVIAAAALVRVYPASDGERYLELLNFGQQVRAKRSKCPDPLSACVADAEQPPANAHLDVFVSVSEDVIEVVPDLAASPLRADPPPSFDGRNAEDLNGKSVVSLSAQWELPEQWGVDAEALGWNPREVLLEAERFRQYWTQGKGSGQRRAVKGWRQSWSNWLGKAAERKR